MKLSQLFHKMDVQIKGKKDLDILGVCAHSQQVAPGYLFFAKKGRKVDGAHFVDAAIAAGAVAVVTDLYNPFLTQVTQIVTQDLHGVEAEVARRFYQDPSQKLFLAGVTGTNGKTTTTYLIRHLLEESKAPCGLIGTIENILGSYHLPSLLTTPDVLTLNKYFYEMVRQGCRAAAVEVSSHALDQARVDKLEWDVAVFTNLSQEHLDYHKTMQEYARAKKKLFTYLVSSTRKSIEKCAVINSDDPLGRELLQELSCRRLSYGIDSASAHLVARDLRFSCEASRFTLAYQGQTVEVETALVGRFNVYNVLAACAVALVKGYSLQQIGEKLKMFKGVPGRLQKVASKAGVSVYVDFAHTPEALEQVCTTLKELTQGHLISVFGCGGDRDKEKRPKMATAAEKYCDRMIFTSDNPRGEDPHKILEEMLVGIKDPSKVIVEPDRRKAIIKALQMAKKKDVVVIAGKGHETIQIFKDKTLPFSDIEVALQG